MDVRAFLTALFVAHLLCITLGQSTSFDCDKCVREPSSCRRISGLYTVTVLKEGTYNPVVEIPAPACSINITELRRSSNYIAVKTSNSIGIINSRWALGQAGQYFGAGTRFSYERQSATCQGSCIYAEGPILNNLIVQILYYDFNPGIAYEFVLPNDVEFRPLDATILSQKESKLSPSAPRTLSDRRVFRHHRKRHSSRSRSSEREPYTSRNPERKLYTPRHSEKQQSTSRSSNGGEFNGEIYTGPLSTRSEGRPEETAEATGSLSPSSSSRRVIANQRLPETKRISYGSHTLGGRGLSYTAYNPARTQPRKSQDERLSALKIRRPGRGRYSQQTRLPIKKIASPSYTAPSSSNSNSRRVYSKQPQYQSFSARTAYSNGHNNGGNAYRRNYNRRNSVSKSNTRYRWKISGLTECSRSCGKGVQKTNIVCVSIGTRNQVVVTSDNCENVYRPRAQTIECNSNPCSAAWEADEWSKCSVTCGYGTQTRKIECRRRFSPTTILRVSADHCGLENKPAVAQQCEERLCAFWQSGTWSQCSKECGGGERQREVKCVDTFNSALPSNYCVEAKPREKEICNSDKCRAQWWLSGWSSECTETCGTGYQFRKALCLNDNGDITPESRCGKKDLPELRKYCDSDTSCRGTWIMSSWGKCSARCGRGRRKRTVVCMFLTSTTMQPTNEEDCNRNLKPPSEETCTESDCQSVWFTSNWSQCSVTCGKGYSTRDVKCLDSNNQLSQSCPSSLKPETRDMCTLDSCNLYQRTDGQGEQKEPEEKCTDIFYNCQLVIQSRLCSTDYYRKRCCQSCRKAHY